MIFFSFFPSLFITSPCHYSHYFCLCLHLPPFYSCLSLFPFIHFSLSYISPTSLVFLPFFSPHSLVLHTFHHLYKGCYLVGCGRVLGREETGCGRGESGCGRMELGCGRGEQGCVLGKSRCGRGESGCWWLWKLGRYAWAWMYKYYWLSVLRGRCREIWDCECVKSVNGRRWTLAVGVWMWDRCWICGRREGWGEGG